MAAMTLDPREPDMSRFIDSYKYERQRDESIKQLSGGVSLPLNSDGYEDLQRFLKEERHKEMVEHQEKLRACREEKGQEPVYYRLGTPEYGLNLGNYDKQRHAMNLERQRDYNNLMKKQRKVEQERIEQRRRNRQPPAAPQGHQIDYNENQELARAEERKAYQDHQKAKEDRYRAMRGRPVTPPGMGLNVGQYDRQVRETKARKTKEYKDSLDQQASERLRYRYFERLAETSPNYYKYRDEERPLVGSPRDINPALFEQQKEQMFLKAQRDTELSVLDRKNQTDSQYLASKPPAGPGYKPRDEAFQTNTYSRPRSRNKELDEGYVPSLSDAPVRGQFYDERSRPPPRDLMPPRSPHRRTPPPRTPPHRREFVAQSEHYNRQPRSPRRKSPPPRTPPPKEQQSDQGSTHQTYTDVSPRRVKALVPEESQYDKMRKEANLERKEDYNKYIKEKEENRKRNVAPRPAGHPAEVVKGPYYSSDNYESYQGELRRKQIEDYKEYLKKAMSLQRGNEVPRRNDYGADVAGPYNGMFHGLGEHGNQKDDLNQQRRQEYNDMLDQVRPNRGRSPLKSPAKTDHYEQMLHEKRREEAQRRRFDDPEYQDKLARLDSRERGPARDQPRYGY